MKETIWALKDVSFEVKRDFALLGAMGRARVTSDFVGHDGADDRASRDLWARSILFLLWKRAFILTGRDAKRRRFLRWLSGTHPEPP